MIPQDESPTTQAMWKMNLLSYIKKEESFIFKKHLNTKPVLVFPLWL